MREQMLQLQVNEMQSQLMSTSSPEMIRLGNENQELRKQNEALKADLARKTRLIESAVLPMVNDKEALLEGTGPLRRALDDKQLSALLEMASLGASPQDMHRLLLGKSETGANLKPFISLAGRLRTVFENAQDEETTVNALESTAMPLTRGKMVQVLRENKISILSDTVEHGLLAEVSFALLSGVDPWSIVNLLDGRISRNSTMDLTVVPELFGVLADADPSEFGTDSPMVSTLEKLSRRCSLCPLQALRQANLELEQSNIALEAQLGDLNNLMAVRQCKWTEKGAPALSPVDLWRLDSIGSNATSSPKQA